MQQMYNLPVTYPALDYIACFTDQYYNPDKLTETSPASKHARYSGNLVINGELWPFRAKPPSVVAMKPPPVWQREMGFLSDLVDQQAKISPGSATESRVWVDYIGSRKDHRDPDYRTPRYRDDAVFLILTNRSFDLKIRIDCKLVFITATGLDYHCLDHRPTATETDPIYWFYRRAGYDQPTRAWRCEPSKSGRAQRRLHCIPMEQNYEIPTDLR